MLDDKPALLQCNGYKAEIILRKRGTRTPSNTTSVCGARSSVVSDFYILCNGEREDVFFFCLFVGIKHA